jgi:hypothetical protein
MRPNQNDNCKALNEKDYYTLPTYRFEDSVVDLYRARSLQNNSNPSLHPIRPDPEARERVHLKRHMAVCPDDLVFEFQRLKVSLAVAQKENSNLMKKLENAEAELKKKDLSVKKEEMRRQVLLNNSGLSRANINSVAWHQKYPWASEFLFGQPSWKEYSLFIKTAFKQYNLDVNEGGTAAISMFEKVTMCVMMIRRGYHHGTLALIYNRSRSSISIYTKNWMPKLGRVGRMFYNIPLELQHNLYTEDYCMEHGLPYLHEGFRNDD